MTIPPPLEGPYVVVWEAFHAPVLTGAEGPWNRLSRTFSLEIDAVHHWGAMCLYANTRPVSVTPEPHWARYSYDGRTPLAK